MRCFVACLKIQIAAHMKTSSQQAVHDGNSPWTDFGKWASASVVVIGLLGYIVVREIWSPIEPGSRHKKPGRFLMGNGRKMRRAEGCGNVSDGGRLDNMSVKHLKRLVKDVDTHLVEKADLIEMARKQFAVQECVMFVFSTFDLRELLLSFLTKADVVRLSGVSTVCYEMANSDRFWEAETKKRLCDRFIPRVPGRDGHVIITGIKEAYVNHFFERTHLPKNVRRNDTWKGWKQFLALTMYCENSLRGGYGNAVIISRPDICPHHILRFVNMLSIRKHGACTLSIMRRFFKLYQSFLKGALNLRSNVGFVFPICNEVSGKREGQEGVSHDDILEITRASNLQVSDLLIFYANQRSI